jgi:hypothetical protein
VTAGGGDPVSPLRGAGEVIKAASYGAGGRLLSRLPASWRVATSRHIGVNTQAGRQRLPS